jgi:hypothetical protein
VKIASMPCFLVRMQIIYGQLCVKFGRCLPWLKSVIVSAELDMIEAILLTSWRAWYAHNEIIHAKPLPSIEGSKRFLVGYHKTFSQIRELSTEELIKGKHTLKIGVKADPITRKRKEPLEQDLAEAIIGVG